MSLTLTAEVPGTLAFRDLLGGIVAGLCHALARERGMEGLDADVLTAFNEAYNNVVIHAYRHAAGNVGLEVTVNDDTLVIRLLDSGQEFRLNDVGTPPFAAGDELAIEDLPEGGMGVYLMRAVMDEVSYLARTENGGRNCLVMMKRLLRVTS